MAYGGELLICHLISFHPYVPYKQMLSENGQHVDDMGDYEALVLCQTAGFTEGEIILYERLNMVPMLLEEYAKSGTARSRRQMLAMCEQHDPEIFADVLFQFVKMAEERLNGVRMLLLFGL